MTEQCRASVSIEVGGEERRVRCERSARHQGPHRAEYAPPSSAAIDNVHGKPTIEVAHVQTWWPR